MIIDVHPRNTDMAVEAIKVEQWSADIAAEWCEGEVVQYGIRVPRGTGSTLAVWGMWIIRKGDLFGVATEDFVRGTIEASYWVTVPERWRGEEPTESVDIDWREARRIVNEELRSRR